MMFTRGFDFIIKDAQQQMRTERDVKGPWVRPRCPSKRAGRKGTRRMWKRTHPPHQTWLYREPTNILVLEQTEGMFMPRKRICIVTPAQFEQIKQQTKPISERFDDYGLRRPPWRT